MREPLEESLNRAIDQLPHPSLEELSRTPVPLMTEHDEITRQKPSRRPAAVRLAACAAALVLALGGGGWYLQTRAVASIVDLDINPSFEITANRRDRVLEVIPVNEDARRSIPDMDFRGMPLEDAVESLVGGLHRAGYLQGRDSVLLLSVGGGSAARTQRIEQNLTERITVLLDEQQSRAAVVRQSLQGDAALRGQARDYQVSEGRMQLVNRILAQEPAFSREKLLEMSLGELVALSGRYGLSLEGIPAVPVPDAQSSRPTPQSGRGGDDDGDDRDDSDRDDNDDDDDDDDRDDHDDNDNGDDRDGNDDGDDDHDDDGSDHDDNDDGDDGDDHDDNDDGDDGDDHDDNDDGDDGSDHDDNDDGDDDDHDGGGDDHDDNDDGDDGNDDDDGSDHDDNDNDD